MARTTQRAIMIQLIAEHGQDRTRVCQEFALAEERGEFDTLRDQELMSAERYARHVWDEGLARGWLLRDDDVTRSGSGYRICQRKTPAF